MWRDITLYNVWSLLLEISREWWSRYFSAHLLARASPRRWLIGCILSWNMQDKTKDFTGSEPNLGAAAKLCWYHHCQSVLSGVCWKVLSLASQTPKDLWYGNFPLTHLQINYIGPLPSSEGAKFSLTYVDTTGFQVSMQVCHLMGCLLRSSTAIYHLQHTWSNWK